MNASSSSNHSPWPSNVSLMFSAFLASVGGRFFLMLLGVFGVDRDAVGVREMDWVDEEDGPF